MKGGRQVLRAWTVVGLLEKDEERKGASDGGARFFTLCPANAGAGRVGLGTV